MRKKLRDLGSEHSVIVSIRLKGNGSYLGVMWHRKQLEVCIDDAWPPLQRFYVGKKAMSFFC